MDKDGPWVGRYRVLKKFAGQSWIPFAIALAWAAWDYHSLRPAERTAAAFFKTLAGGFFFVMYFVGQWFRAGKQLEDAEQRSTLNNLYKMVQGLSLPPHPGTAGVPEIGRTDATLGTGRASSVGTSNDAEARVLDELRRSPKGALLLVGAEIERTLRQLLWASGWHAEVPKITITSGTRHLVELGVVAPNLASSVEVFLDVRNRMLHGHSASDDEVLRAIDIGLTILRALSIPMEEHRVYQTDVVVFEDEAGSKPRDVRAIILDSQSPGGSHSRRQPYPVGSTDLRKGQRVSWEWDMSRRFGPSWYRDPDTGEMKKAWDGSVEFAGRNLDEI
jgi:hypothetical protein